MYSHTCSNSCVCTCIYPCQHTCLHMSIHMSVIMSRHMSRHRYGFSQSVTWFVVLAVLLSDTVSIKIDFQDPHGLSGTFSRIDEAVFVRTVSTRAFQRLVAHASRMSVRVSTRMSLHRYGFSQSVTWLVVLAVLLSDAVSITGLGTFSLWIIDAHNNRIARVYADARTHGHVHVHTHVHMHVYAHVRTHVLAHVYTPYTCLHACPYTCLHTCLHACPCARLQMPLPRVKS